VFRFALELCTRGPQRVCVQEEGLFSVEFKRGFQCFAQQQARYMIGEGWKRNAYVTGVNDKGYKRLVHRGASCPAYPKPCPPDTPASNKPDVNTLVGGLLWLPLVRLSLQTRLAHVARCRSPRAC
jgi:hypothetical protein